MTAPARRRPLPLALLLVLAGTGLVAPAVAQEAPAPVRRNVGGYPVSAPAATPQTLVPPAASAPAATAPARPATPPPPRTTGQPKTTHTPAKAKSSPPRPTNTAPPAHTTPAQPKKPAAPATGTPPPGTPPAPALRRTTSERGSLPGDALMADARALTADGLRASTLPAAAGTTTSTARSDAPVNTATDPARRTGSSKWRIDPKFLPTVIVYEGPERPGTIIIDTEARFLYLVEPDGQARRYGIGVGRPGFEWAGKHRVTRKAEWPDWRPPPEMRARQPKLPAYMPGGPRNPLGARALYLGSTLYRIHGSNEPWSIGRAVSSGCIRMRNEDVTDLYDRVPVGTTVIVR